MRYLYPMSGNSCVGATKLYQQSKQALSVKAVFTFLQQTLISVDFG